MKQTLVFSKDDWWTSTQLIFFKEIVIFFKLHKYVQLYWLRICRCYKWPVQHAPHEMNLKPQIWACWTEGTNPPAFRPRWYLREETRLYSPLMAAVLACGFHNISEQQAPLSTRGKDTTNIGRMKYIAGEWNDICLTHTSLWVLDGIVYIILFCS